MRLKVWDGKAAQANGTRAVLTIVTCLPAVLPRRALEPSGPSGPGSFDPGPSGSEAGAGVAGGAVTAWEEAIPLLIAGGTDGAFYFWSTEVSASRKSNLALDLSTPQDTRIWHPR